MLSTTRTCRGAPCAGAGFATRTRRAHTGAARAAISATASSSARIRRCATSCAAWWRVSGACRLVTRGMRAPCAGVARRTRTTPRRISVRRAHSAARVCAHRPSSAHRPRSISPMTPPSCARTAVKRARLAKWFSPTRRAASASRTSRSWCSNPAATRESAKRAHGAWRQIDAPNNRPSAPHPFRASRCPSRRSRMTCWHSCCAIGPAVVTCAKRGATRPTRRYERALSRTWCACSRRCACVSLARRSSGACGTTPIRTFARRRTCAPRANEHAMR